MEIRRVLPTEYDAAGRITADAYLEHVTPEWEEDWRHYLAEMADIRGRAGISTVLVAVEDGRILGSATVEYDRPISGGDPPVAPDEARLRMLGVDPGARGIGVGQALLDAAIEDARANGRRRMVLNTTDRMLAAQRLYERNGFVREDDVSLDNEFRMRTYGRDL